MCCTIGDDEAKLTDTKLYVGEALKDDKYVHVLAYQNMAESASGSKWIPNAMIIPFPTDVPMGPDNVIDTKEYPDFLDDIGEATRERPRYLSVNDDDDYLIGAAADSLSFAQVFDVGSYTVILADHVSQIPEALSRVDSMRRPQITTRFLIGYNKMYPKQPVALCCWVGSLDKIEPLLWWYEPRDKDNLFIPTMDAHDGNPPDVNATVKTDHVISVGSRMFPGGKLVSYQNDKAKENDLLPTNVYGHRLLPSMKNGDMFVSTAAVRSTSKNKPIIKRAASLSEKESYSSPMIGWFL